MSDTIFEVKEDSSVAQADPADVILAKLIILKNGFDSLQQTISEFSSLDEFKSVESLKKLLSEHTDESAARILYHLTCLNSVNHGLALLQSNVQSLLKAYNASKLGE